MSTACRIRRHHKFNGNLGLQLDNIAIKWCLNVCISCSEMRSRCRTSGTSCFWAHVERMEGFIPYAHFCPACAGMAGYRGL